MERLSPAARCAANAATPPLTSLRPTAPTRPGQQTYVGQLNTLDGAYCYPLTVQDAHSRFLLDCKGMPGLDMAAVSRRFDRLFSSLGLLEAIRTDNGHTFASSTGLGRLSRLSVFFLKLGASGPSSFSPEGPSRMAVTSACTAR